MLRSVHLIVAAAALAVPAMALAAESTTGTIKTINSVTRQVTLDDGKVYTAQGSIDMAKLKVGDKVKVTFDPANPTFASLGIAGSATQITATN